MTYQTTITQKGQVTIPKAVRERLGLKSGDQVTFEYDPKQQKASIRPTEDFLAVAARLSKKIRNRVDPLKAREHMETHYERI